MDFTREDTTIFNFFGRKQNSKPLMEALAEVKADPAIRLVDVRSRQEFASGHIPGAVNLPVDELQKAPTVLEDKAATVYLYCASGSRSGMAAGMLGRMRYDKCTNIGGIISYAGQLER